MLEMPRRSVTRFFIPLIDVLILLFCIFLMMPAVKKTAEAEVGAAAPQEEKQAELERREHAVEQKEQQLRAGMDQLRRETTHKVLSQLAPRVLDINASNGKLYYRNPDPVEVSNQNEARALIRRDRSGPGGPDAAYYILRYPADPNSGFPRSGDLEKYQQWFEGVPVEFEKGGAKVEFPK